MSRINTRKRGGKAAFYRMGFQFGFQYGTNRRPWADIGVHRWPDWAKEAYCVGLLNGKAERAFARCIHEPLANRDRREIQRCVHCGMKMRALRRANRG